MTAGFKLKFLFLFLASIVCSCDRPVLKLDPTPKLREIQVVCEENQVPSLVYLPCEATGIYSDGSARSVTYEAKWTSSQPTIIESSSTTHPSWVRGIAPGASSIIATVGAVKGSFNISITAAIPISLVVAPANQVFHTGIQQQFTSICVFSDSSFFDVTRSATWISQNPAFASVQTDDANFAMVTAKALGSTRIEATFNGVSGSTAITVLDKVLLAIQVGPTSSTVIQGLSTAFTLTGIYTDMSTEDLTTVATWSILDGTIASVSNTAGQRGKLLALQPGSTQVLATYGGFNDSTSVTVINPTLTSITLSPVNSSIAKGLNQQLTATGHYSDGSTANVSEVATWTSSSTGVATVSNLATQKGKTSGAAVGTATISATINGITGSTDITITAAVLSSIAVTPSVPSVPLGTTQGLTATGTYTDGSTQDLTSTATWSSSATSKAIVSDVIGTKGVVTPVAFGAAIISATVGGVVGQTTVTILPPTLTSIAITPVNDSVVKGLTKQYMAMGTYSDGSTADISSTVTWGSADSSIASISNTAGSKGLATGAGVGTTSISATLSGVTDSTNITVTPAVLVSITVTPAGATVILLQTISFVATGTYTDGSTANLTNSVTWASTNTLTATISNTAPNKGRASGVGLGTTIISATLGGVSGSTPLNGIL